MSRLRLAPRQALQGVARPVLLPRVSAARLPVAAHGPVGPTTLAGFRVAEVLTPTTHTGRASAVCRRSRRGCTGAPTTGSRTSCNGRRLAPCRRPGWFASSDQTYS